MGGGTRGRWGGATSFVGVNRAARTRHKKQGEDDASLLVEQLLRRINERLAKGLVVSMRYRGAQERR